MRPALPRSRPRRVILGIGALLLVGSVSTPLIEEISEAGRSDTAVAAHSVAPAASPLAGAHRTAIAHQHPCGRASAAIVGAVDAQVAQRIYADELAGGETVIDQAHIRESRALARALVAGNRAAVFAAVHAIVYTPHWHIVRLRVLKAGQVLADVGGPYVIAPVSGTLARHGRTIGRYVMSVQDDAGYVKLISRFIGVPVDLYRGRSFVMGTLQPAPPLPQSGASVSAGGIGYRVRLLKARAFPAGGLEAALFAPAPARAVSSLGCSHVLAHAWGSIAMHIAARFRPLSAHLADLAAVVRAVTGARVFVLSHGREIAGGSMPARLPSSGTARIAGHSRGVFSWAVSAGTRVYVLTP